NITVYRNGTTIKSDVEGRFYVNVIDTLAVTCTSLGFRPKDKTLKNDDMYIYLEPEYRTIEEVSISTGYQQIKRGSHPGSFVVLDSTLLERAIGTDIISRLEGVTSGLNFDRRMQHIPVASPSSLVNRGNTVMMNIRGVG